MNSEPLCFPALFRAFLLGTACSSRKHTPNPMLKAGAQDTDLARHENALAYELLQQGNYDKAQEHLVLALAADPLFGPAHNNRGLVYYHTGRLYLAAWEFENAIKLMPYQSEPRNN